MKWLVRLYPRTWRHRYGREIAELLAASEHPWRDNANVALYAALAWSEVAMVKPVMLILAAASLAVFGYTVGQLTSGVREIPQHWWSSLAAAVAVIAVAGAIVSLTRSHSTDRA